METKSRSKEAQKIINERLSNYFTEDQLSYLDDLGIEILADYFSNKELRDLQDATPAILKGFVDRNQNNEVKRRLTHVGEDELAGLMDWYKENCSEVEEVVCPNHNEVIALEVKHKTLKNSPKVHWDGRFIVAVGNRLASTRTRLDGVVGYQCNIPLQAPNFVDDWSKFYAKREKAFAVYQGKVEKAKAAHQKKVDKAIATHEKQIAAFDKKLNDMNIGPDDPGAPAVPKYKDPKYVGPAAFDEPERPEIEQFIQCLDTRWSVPETEVIAEDHVMSSITNSDIVEVKRHIEATGYKKPVTKVKDGYKVDQFILRKVK